MPSLLVHAALGALTIRTMIDGPRRGLRWTWISFVMSPFTSFGFAMAMYRAAPGRQVCWNEVHA
jgi:hypothetical protein